MSAIKARKGTIDMPALLPFGGRSASMHALYHRTCGHAVMVGPDRQTLVNVVGNLRGHGRFALRIRIATSDDIESATRGITCNLCRALT